jgi:hypothetical protein
MKAMMISNGNAVLQAELFINGTLEGGVPIVYKAGR